MEVSQWIHPGGWRRRAGYPTAWKRIDMETTFIDGDNIEDGSVEINLDIEDIEELLNVNEDERMRKLHRTNSVIEEQIMDV